MVDFNHTKNNAGQTFSEAPRDEAPREEFREEVPQGSIFDSLKRTSTTYNKNVSELLSKAVEELNKMASAGMADENPLGLNFAVFTDDLLLPVIVAYNTKASAHTAFYSFLIEDGLKREPVTPYTARLKQSGETVEVYRDNTYIADGELFARLRKMMGSLLSGKTEGVHETAFMLVPKGTDLENLELLQIMYATADRNLRSVMIPTPYTLASFLKAQAPLDIKHDIHPGSTVLDPFTGQPIFSDFTMTASVVDPASIPQRGNNNRSLNTQEEKYTLAKVDGYVDFVFCPSEQKVPVGNPALNDFAVQSWEPVIILDLIRGMDFNTNRVIESFETMVFGIIGILELMDSQNGRPNWTEIFTQAGPERADLGELTWVRDGYWPPRLPEAAKTVIDYSPERYSYGYAYDKDQAGTVKLMDFLAHNMYNKITLGIDHIPGTRSSWLTDLLYAASLEGKPGEKARVRLFKMFNYVLDGKLAKYMKEGDSIMQVGNQAVIPVGQFRDNQSGELHDIREASTKCNMAKLLQDNAGRQIQTFDNIYFDSDVNTESGLFNIDASRRIMESILSNYTDVDMRQGFRIWFDPKFLQNVVAATVDDHAVYRMKVRTEGLLPANAERAYGLGFQTGTINAGGVFAQRYEQVDNGGYYNGPSVHTSNYWGR